MSKSESTPAKVTLVVTADPGTEIFIIDHSFKLVERGFGSMSRDLEPGVYKIKFRAGSLTKEVNQVIEPSPGKVVVHSPPMAFSSAAPLSSTRKIHEYQRDAAAQLSTSVQKSFGSGGQLFVFARTWTESSAESAGIQTVSLPAGHNPAATLTLHDRDGHLMLDFENAARQGDLNRQDPWAALNIDVDPGTYRLRIQIPELGALEQAVVVSPRWQTQVFLLQRNYGTADQPAFRPDLGHASILLSRIGNGFDPSSEEFRLVELARIALCSRRTFVPSHLLDQMLDAKFENPTLGIFAAHALVADPAADATRRLKLILQNLTRMLGRHPDVDALHLHIGEAADKFNESFQSPPMLQSSWSIVVKKALDYPSLIRRGSLSARISSYLWGEGPWLIWQADQLQESTADEPSRFAQAISEIRGIVSKVVEGKDRPDLVEGLSNMEEALITQVARRQKWEAKRPKAAADVARTPSDAASLMRSLAETLGVPPASLQDTIASVVKKMGSKI
jgi:hypothetical protein